MLPSKRTCFSLFLAGLDGVVLSSAFLLSYWIRFSVPGLPVMPSQSLELYVRFSLILSAVVVLILFNSSFYREQAAEFGWEEFFSLIRAVTLTTVVGVFVTFLFRGYLNLPDTLPYSRLMLALWWVNAIFLMTVWRLFVSRHARYLGELGGSGNRTLIVGTNVRSQRFVEAITRSRRRAYEPVGLVSVPEHEDGQSELEIVGTVDELARLLAEGIADRVVIADTSIGTERVVQIFNACDRTDVKLSIIPDLFEVVSSSSQMREIAGVPVFEVQPEVVRQWGRAVKRTMDLVLGPMILLFLTPVFLLTCVAIWLESGRPFFFSQQRVGKGERHFRMLKFRSMHVGAEKLREEMAPLNETGGHVFKVRSDPRMTRVGRWLRRFSIDELPQIINVLRGEMSLVGPRPYPVYEVSQFNHTERKRFDLMPGITGLAQVSGRSDLDFEEGIRLDLFYIETWSPWLDIKILFKTIPAVLRGRGAY
jgi:exopolysaccharide biosynthesis polyprenyl glycosylphosphotransferase